MRIRSSSIDRTTSSVSSVDPSSRTTSSKSVYVCANTERMVRSTYCVPLYVGMQTETAGVVTAVSRLAVSSRGAEHLVHDVQRPALGLAVDASEVLAEHADAQQ